MLNACRYSWCGFDWILQVVFEVPAQILSILRRYLKLEFGSGFPSDAVLLKEDFNPVRSFKLFGMCEPQGWHSFPQVHSIGLSLANWKNGDGTAYALRAKRRTKSRSKPSD
jgi:hypothetical protein